MNYRVIREQGYWYVESADRRSWWTVSDSAEAIFNHKGSALSPSGPTAVKLIRAITEHIAASTPTHTEEP